MYFGFDRSLVIYYVYKENMRCRFYNIMGDLPDRLILTLKLYPLNKPVLFCFGV